ncbi:MAG: hypothetical protein O9276_01690 [Microcystis sp. LE17-20A]|uniref:hypothetical protein n=1 Tax=unclassified Microcystis TaxID=2643300 RepID=UPI0022C58BB0|nr:MULTISPECIES: hypothetical protein [unclassified Microcystis]MCZ8036861.1 hypothetical protein [Microcystis sp. LE17-20A]MCZ8213407.1 hypothetical protein [Microcystis sp. LE19-8.1F]
MPEIPMFSELYEGRGVNPDTLRTFSVGINFEPLVSLLNPQGQVSTLTMQTVTNTSELASSLNVSASAALTTIRGGGSAEAKFLQQRQVNTYYTYSLVKVYVENPSKLIRNVTLDDSAIKRLKDGGWDEFSQVYGTQYVEGYITGGTYYALIEVQTTNAEEKREISAKLSGKYSGVGVKIKGSGEAQSRMQEATENRTTNVYVFQGGGSGDVLEVTMEEMIKQALEFPKLVKDAPVPVRAIINDYKSIKNVPSITLIPSKQRSVLERLGRSYMKLRDYKAKLEFVRDNIELFDEYRELSQGARGQKRKELDNHRENVLDAMQLIADSADECVDDSKQCKIPTTLSDDLFTSIPLPEVPETELPTRINCTPVTAPINASSLARLKEYDVPNQKKFEVEVKLSTLILEEKLPSNLRRVGLGIYATKSNKIASITRVINNGGHLLIADFGSEQTYEGYPEDVVYFKIIKQDDEVDLLFSRNGSYFKSMGKRNLRNLGFTADDTYKVIFTGYSTDSTPISGKFYDLIIT